MNHIKKTILSILLAMGVITSCNDDFVNTQPLTDVPSDAVWKDAGLATAFVTEFYSGLGQGGLDEQMLASLTDEAMFTHPGRGINTITEARTNPADRGWMNGTLDWAPMYSRIRATNLALKNLEAPQFPNVAGIADRLKGEAHFMRAYFHHQLVRYFGGVPIIDKSYELGEADYMIERNSYEDCVNFIVGECDAAAAAFDVATAAGATTASGRATKAAALALKARMLIYAASDLHHIPTANANSTLIAGYGNPELLGYTGGDRTARWQAAKDAAKAVLDLPGLGYETALAAPVSAAQGTANYMNIALAKFGGERELIFARHFIDAKAEAAGPWVGRNNGPNGYHNWAGNTPTQQLVDDYEMMDGTKFDWTNPAHSAAPYSNRDPRLDATVLHDASPWKPRVGSGLGKDPANQIQTGQYEVVNASGAKVFVFGLDTRNSVVENWNGSHTGYYMRKFIDPNPAITDMNTRQQIPWPFLRYTEAMLNYAEACIELGQDDEAKTWLNKIRFRAGMPAITETGIALKDRYRNERRVELVYEEHRFHDARRWMIAPATLGRKVGIIDIKGTLKPGASVTVYKYDPTTHNYVYTPSTTNFENRQWLDKMYYFPIHIDEMNRNLKLVQNPGF
jgi:starch-binding outer membrane protein, SusD/RagB family